MKNNSTRSNLKIYKIYLIKSKVFFDKTNVIGTYKRLIVFCYKNEYKFFLFVTFLKVFQFKIDINTHTQPVAKAITKSKV